MYTGVVPLAPEWVQHCGIEFLYRFAREPRRLFHRYFVRDTSFLPLMLREVHDVRRVSVGGRG
jgi:N-acetylglucosaminyldiphosphoundecaprenol N-acetyl-beta-D-mannosaminyltransferase